MASLDDVYDMVQKLDETKTEYLLITIQQGKKNGKADIFYNLNNDKSLAILSKGLKLFQEKIENEQDNEK